VPKLKTHKGAARRFHLTGTGKVRRMKGNRSHLRRKKPSSVKRQYSHKLELSGGDEKRILKLLPNGLPK
jgi:large subunit ribosomal protein L35